MTTPRKFRPGARVRFLNEDKTLGASSIVVGFLLSNPPVCACRFVKSGRAYDAPEGRLVYEALEPQTETDFQIWNDAVERAVKDGQRCIGMYNMGTEDGVSFYRVSATSSKSYDYVLRGDAITYVEHSTALAGLLQKSIDALEAAKQNEPEPTLADHFLTVRIFLDYVRVQGWKYDNQITADFEKAINTIRKHCGI